MWGSVYGKIFAQIYDGSLYGQWEALVTFQQMIVLADKDGNVDMTPEAISARTSIPLDIIQRGLAQLAAPDDRSRTPDEQGRRIVLLDTHRSWGWRLTNYKTYAAIRTAEERREYFKQYKRRQRASKQQSPPAVHNVNRKGSDSTNTDRAADRPTEAVAGSTRSISQSARETLLASTGTRRKAWEGVIAQAQDGMLGAAYKATDAQIETACADFLAVAEADTKPSPAHFRAFIRRAVKGAKPEADASDELAALHRWALEKDAAEGRA